MSLQCFPYQGWEARLRSRWTQIFLLMLKATVAGDERESPQLTCFGDRGSPQRGRTPKAQGGFCISGSCILCGNSGGGLTAVAQRGPRISVRMLPADWGRFPIAGKCFQHRQRLRYGQVSQETEVVSGFLMLPRNTKYLWVAPAHKCISLHHQ